MCVCECVSNGSITRRTCKLCTTTTCHRRIHGEAKDVDAGPTSTCHTCVETNASTSHRRNVPSCEPKEGSTTCSTRRTPLRTARNVRGNIHASCTSSSSSASASCRLHSSRFASFRRTHTCRGHVGSTQTRRRRATRQTTARRRHGVVLRTTWTCWKVPHLHG